MYLQTFFVRISPPAFTRMTVRFADKGDLISEAGPPKFPWDGSGWPAPAKDPLLLTLSPHFL